ncbi:hypothetical protein MNBD_GAMMA12-1744 [hydrothermal vent metagenome]|uniref:Uncharacterized protein n=1 Tax=hydrothermal vent metagenome TaxID=652676 RepID=A0A3B0XVI9_9ZZZZ
MYLFVIIESISMLVLDGLFINTIGLGVGWSEIKFCVFGASALKSTRGKLEDSFEPINGNKSRLSQGA